jgi:septum formation protein
MLPPLILASASPRRLGLLTAVGVTVHHVIPAEIDESRPQGLSPLAHVSRLAEAKAQRVAEAVGPRGWVLAADTIVHRGDVLYEKPADAAEAVATLGALAGGWHSVSTAWALVPAAGLAGRALAGRSTTQVRFRGLGAPAIAAYVATGEGLDKAGAYAIQGMGAALVEALDGDLSNVVGLPLGPVLEALRAAGVHP